MKCIVALFIALITLTGQAVAASDSFTDIDATPLTTHDPNWTMISGSFSLRDVVIKGNALWLPYWAYAVNMFYAASSSDQSEITTVAGLSNLYDTVGVSVRSSATNQGYRAYLMDNDGTNWTTLKCVKNGAWFTDAGTIRVKLPVNVPHTLEVGVISTGSTADITIKLDGVTVKTVTDPANPLPPGSPGVYLTTGSIPKSVISHWTDKLGMPGACGPNNGTTLNALSSANPDHIVETVMNAGIELGSNSYITIQNMSFTKYRYGIVST